MSTPFNINLSRRTLNRDIHVATRFLSALSRSPEIRATLEEAAGYSEAEHDRGWAIVRRVTGYRRSDATPGAAGALAQAQALAELNAWDGPAFERARAALRLPFPSQYSFVFEELVAEEGPDVMRSARTFIDRVVTLRDGTDPHRESSREEDREAVRVLGVRRIFDAEIQGRLEALLSQAAKLAPRRTEEGVSDFEAAARDLHLWINDWRGQARAVILRRDYLVRLGFSRRGNADEEEVTTEEEAPLSEAS